MIPLQKICNAFDLGVPKNEPTRIYGGMMHDTWFLRTDFGDYAIKKINDQNMQLLENTLLPIHLAESLARKMCEKNIPTRNALSYGAEYFIIIEDQKWQVLPWIDGESIEDKITVSMSKKIGHLLKRIHSINPDFKGIPHSPWFGFSNEYWCSLLSQAEQKKSSWVDVVSDALPKLLHCNQHAKSVKNILTQQCIISHRDLSPSNVVWNKDSQPVLIDWEWGGLIHPELELFITAMYWSLSPEDGVNQPNFDAVIAGYGTNFTVSQDVLLAGYLGYLLAWLQFNMQRDIQSEQGDSTAVECIRYTLSMLSQLV